MSKELRKFNNLEELNGFISEGKILYSIASAGNIWFIEFDNSDISKTENAEDKLLSCIERAKLLGYVEELRGEIKVTNSKAFCSLFIGMDEITRKQAREYCYTHSTAMNTRYYDLELYLELR